MRASPTRVSRCRGLGSGPHGYYPETEMVPASTVLKDAKARGFYCVTCAGVKSCTSS